MSDHQGIPSALVKELIKRRHELNLSQIEVDLRMDSRPSQCGKWESGMRNPQLNSLISWCAVLNTELKLVPMRGTDGEEAEGQGQPHRTEPC